MTFRERFKKDFPCFVLNPDVCPKGYGYRVKCDDNDMTCVKCWDREMPGTEAEEENPYITRVSALIRKQYDKGVSKYGEPLSSNTTLSTDQRIEHLQEELVDALMYSVHLQQIKDTMTANDYQRQAMRTAGDKSEGWLDNAIMGLCGEVGECADIVKKHRFQGHDLDREKLIDEASDVCWYIALLASALGVGLEDIMKHNIDKLRKRYPNGFDKARSINRNGTWERSIRYVPIEHHGIQAYTQVNDYVHTRCGFHSTEKTPYCPICGALMDGQE